jgi:hypothetical protein
MPSTPGDGAASVAIVEEGSLYSASRKPRRRVLGNLKTLKGLVENRKPKQAGGLSK